jgi:hypothetical protein
MKTLTCKNCWILPPIFLYVVDDLYGNLTAADAIERLAAGKRGRIALVYNGDFRWLDAEDE